MDRNKAARLWPVIKAFSEGNSIQYRHEDVGRFGGEWTDLPDNPAVIQQFPIADYEYRIKLEPREFWIVIDERGIYAERSRSRAEGLFLRGDELIKVREVLE